MTLRRQVSLVALLAFASAQSALACGICIEKPEESIADRLLSADAAVIAREDPAEPYSFAPMTFLSGIPNGTEIPFLVDSSTKRRLDRNPSDGILMLREGQEWTRAGYANANWREVASMILDHEPEWQGDPAARFSFFEPLMQETDPFLRHLATDELSRASYDLIRGMTRPIEGQVARQSLSDRFEYPWHGFYILMLGLSHRADDHELVRDRMATAARTGGGRYLEAWATAWVEIDGADAVNKLVATWFDAPQSSADELRVIISALSVQARYGAPGLKKPVLAALAELPHRRPDVAGSVATALALSGDFSHGKAIRGVIATLSDDDARSIDAAELFAVSSYAHRARYSGGIGFDPLLLEN